MIFRITRQGFPTAKLFAGISLVTTLPVSYTHLDVYKRQVWTGTKAKELGLVDELGGLDKALEISIGKAGLDAYTVMSYPGKKSFFDMLTDTKPRCV